MSDFNILLWDQQGSHSWACVLGDYPLSPPRLKCDAFRGQGMRGGAANLKFLLKLVKGSTKYDLT